MPLGHRLSENRRRKIWHKRSYRKIICFFKLPFQVSFFFILIFSTVNRKYGHYENFADDMIWVADLWYWKHLICQLSQNHCHMLTLQFVISRCCCLKSISFEKFRATTQLWNKAFWLDVASHMTSFNQSVVNLKKFYEFVSKK